MSFSVNTNSGAFIALQNLSNTGGQLSQTQNRISTGLKVASTKDDSASFAIAQNLRADVGGLNAVKSSLARAKSTLDVGVNAAEAISDVLVSMKEKATAAMDAGVDAASRTALQNDFNAMRDQITNLIDTAEFNGTNVLKTGGGAIAALLTDDNAAGTTLDVANVGLAAGAGVAATTWGTAAAAATSKTAVDGAITSMNTNLSTLGSASRRIDAQSKFVSKLSDTIEGGIGNLVDADMARESAKLQSLQVKQQLGIQALSIANQAPSSVLGLFR